MRLRYLWTWAVAAAVGVAAAVPETRIQHQDQIQQRGIDQREAQDVINQLGLIPNVERGFWTESFRDVETQPGTNRSVSTAIYYLLKGDEGQSRWHRLDATEVWHYYAGAPMAVYQSANNGSGINKSMLGPDIFASDHQRPQVVIPRHIWQSVESLGDWTLVGTTVAPGFVSEKLAASDWAPQ